MGTSKLQATNPSNDTKQLWDLCSSQYYMFRQNLDHSHDNSLLLKYVLCINMTIEVFFMSILGNHLNLCGAWVAGLRLVSYQWWVQAPAKAPVVSLSKKLY